MTVHASPPSGDYRVPCCGRTLTDVILDGHTTTLAPHAVTCGRARHTVDTITSDALDQLYARIDTLERVAKSSKCHAQIIVQELETADAARLALRRRAEQAEADRAAVLREAADVAETVAIRLHAQHDIGGSTGAYEAMTELRRMADETQPAPPHGHRPCCEATIGHRPNCPTNQPKDRP
ncbi:hypothetical protein [Streptomyces sp. PR69]|uniref:hypothetical protein n=1 Tax=Streptomyces sp. PR69 TaxID=2984950 RepID=UPI0022647736|nr:hypothetical protein [Streptomyces sp. PR69]